jgi:hypothetical protein
VNLSADQAAARAFIESTQERFYTRLAIARGWDPDPRQAHRRFTALGAPTNIPTEPLKKALRHESIPAADWAAFDETVKRQFAQYQAVISASPYEDPVFFPMISMIFERVYRALEDVGFGVAHQPLIATLPSGHVNALSWPVPDTPLRAIFFEQGLFRYMHHMSIAAGWALPRVPLAALTADAVLLQLPSRHEIPIEASEIFGGMLVSYTSNGAPPPGEGAVPMPQDNLAIVVSLLNFMEEFVLAHELAHVMNRDAERLESGAVSHWDAEYQADRLAAHVVTALACRAGHAFGVAFAGCDLALTVLHYLDVALATLQYGAKPFTWISSTHPDALSRRDALHSCLDDMTPPDAPAAADAARMVCRLTDVILGRLWRLTAPGLILAFEGGTRPSSIWRDHLRTSVAIADGLMDPVKGAYGNVAN